jgi:electron transport complex protein RnfA
MDYKIFVTILMSAVLVNNYVLRQFLGICPFLGVSKELKNAIGMSIAVIFVMLLATAVTWPIRKYLLDKNNLGFLQTIVFILVIASLVQLVEITLKNLCRHCTKRLEFTFHSSRQTAPCWE